MYRFPWVCSVADVLDVAVQSLLWFRGSDERAAVPGTPGDVRLRAVRHPAHRGQGTERQPGLPLPRHRALHRLCRHLCAPRHHPHPEGGQQIQGKEGQQEALIPPRKEGRKEEEEDVIPAISLLLFSACSMCVFRKN